MSKKLDKSIMDAYASIYEARRGHASGTSDLEKQASQLASDVRYKAKGKVKEGTNREELKKIYLGLIQSSPAPNVVKQMAKKKLIGEGYIPEEGYDIARDMGRVSPTKDKKDATTAPRKPISKKEREESEQRSKEGYDSVIASLKKKYGNKAVITNTKEETELEKIQTAIKTKTMNGKKLNDKQVQGLDAGLTQGGNKSVLQREMRFDDGEEGTKKRKEALRKKRGMTKDEMDKHPQFKKDEDVKEGSAYGIFKGDGVMKIGKKKEEKAPRKQKGAMAYDGPNKRRSEAADRIIAKTKKKREKMDEMACGTPSVMDTKSKKKKKSGMSLTKESVRNPETGLPTMNKKDNRPDTTKFDVKDPNQRRSMKVEGMDPVGKEDGDINNDGKKDSTDKYLKKRRAAIGVAIAKKRGRVKEGFSAWRIDLNFDEQLKK